MMLPSVTPSIQDFHLVQTRVEVLSREQEISKPSAFVYLALDLILSIPEDEIRDAITDTSYLSETIRSAEFNSKGHDRGIDAIYIDDNSVPAKVHIFNCKYTDKIDKTTNNFPASEIDKIISFISSVIQKDVGIENSINQALFAKVEDIWQLFRNQNPHFVIHICGNFYKGIESSEDKRFRIQINKFSNFSIEYNLMGYFVNRLINVSSG